MNKVKRKYDFQSIALQYSFNRSDIEKTCRISDILEDISAVKFLSDRLSLYGGTAFTFIYSPQILRLSIDLDLNYRHKNTADWGEVRKEIDKRIKEILYKQGYENKNIAISASYPLTRFTVKYLNDAGIEDTCKIEIGYMRRTPILKIDTQAEFHHIGTQETFKTTTPEKEELFANKFCAMLYRKTARDVFDIHRVSEIKFDYDKFRKCAIIDSLTRKKPKLYEIDPDSINTIAFDSSLKNLLQTEKLEKFDFKEIVRKVTLFTLTQLEHVTSDERKMIDKFWDQKNYRPNLIDPDGIFNKNIPEYPAVLWALERIAPKKKTPEAE